MSLVYKLIRFVFVKDGHLKLTNGEYFSSDGAN